VSPTFRALKNPNYKLWASGAIVSNTGTWMQRVAQDWLVLTQLSHNSGVAVGITTGLQFAPVLLLAPVSGAIADRFDRRKILITTQVSSGVLALILGLLVVTDVAQLWQVYVLAGLLGVVAAVDGPARQAFVSELVPIEDLPNAVGLNSASFNGGRLIGPGIAGILIHWFGTGPVFLVNAATFGAVVLSLTRMRRGELRPQPRTGRGKGSVRAGLVYVRHRPDLILILAIVGVVGTFGLNFQITTALMARLVFHKGAGEYGLLGSVMAIGSLGGALLAARREHPRLRLVVGATFAFGVTSIIAALMPTYWSFAVALIPVGLSSLTLMTAANATIQLSTSPAMRGRVMALYMAIFMGGTPIGAPIVGWVGEAFGARYTILFGGVVCMLTAAAAVLWVHHTQGLTITYRPRPSISATPPALAAQSALAATDLSDNKSAA
jgi:MFS family permease